MTFQLSFNVQATTEVYTYWHTLSLHHAVPICERYRLLQLEADRSTEPGRSGSFDRKSQLRTALQYRTYIGEGLYKTHLGVSAPLLVLTVTTSAARLSPLVALVAETSVSSRNSFKIGRASYGERACQYWLISVVAVSKQK